LPLAEKVYQLATRLERSRGWIIKQALSAWIDQEEEDRTGVRSCIITIYSVYGVCQIRSNGRSLIE